MINKRREIERSLVQESLEAKTEEYFVINSEWFAAWKVYAFNKKTDTSFESTLLRESKNPDLGFLPIGPINNWALFEKCSSKEPKKRNIKKKEIM